MRARVGGAVRRRPTSPAGGGSRLEEIVAVAGLILFFGAIVPLLQRVAGVGPNVGEGDRFTQALLAPLYLASVLALVWRKRRPSPFVIATAHPLTWGLIGWALLSASWSDISTITLRRSMALAACTIFALFLVFRFSYDRTLHLIGKTLLIIAILSILFVAVPGYGISGGVYSGAWQGAFADKNSLGRAMVLSAFTFATFALAARGRARLWNWVVVLMSCLLVLLSRSTTSLLVLVVMALLVLICMGLRTRRSRFLTLSFAGVLCSGGVLLAAMAQHEALLGTLGKDTTFTGRTSLWVSSIEQIAERPLVGYGFGGFWTGWSGRGAVVWEQVGWTPPHAHNGVIDLGLELGLVGILILVAGFALTFKRAFARIRPSADAREIWPLLYLCFLVLSNMTESALVRQNNVFWVLYCVVAFVVARRPQQRDTSIDAMAMPAHASIAADSIDIGQAGPREAGLSPGVRRRLRERAVRRSAPFRGPDD